MSKYFKHIIFYTAIVCPLLFNSCKKSYPEGPRITFRKAEKRLTKQKWLLFRVEKNGKENTLEYRNKCPYSKWICFEYEADDQYINTKARYPLPYETLKDCKHCSCWSFSNDLQSLRMNSAFVYPYDTINYGGNNKHIKYIRFQPQNYDSLKLINKKLILQTQYKGKKFTLFYNAE